MGFYAPAQIVRDARDHGVKVRPVCVNNSRFDCTLEPTGEKDAKGDERFAVRLGMRLVKGLSNKHAADIVNVRQDRSLPRWMISGEGRAFPPLPSSVSRKPMPFTVAFACQTRGALGHQGLAG